MQLLSHVYHRHHDHHFELAIVVLLTISVESYSKALWTIIMLHRASVSIFVLAVLIVEPMSRPVIVDGILSALSTIK